MSQLSQTSTFNHNNYIRKMVKPMKFLSWEAFSTLVLNFRIRILFSNTSSLRSCLKIRACFTCTNNKKLRGKGKYRSMDNTKIRIKRGNPYRRNEQISVRKAQINTWKLTRYVSTITVVFLNQNRINVCEHTEI